MLKIIDIGLFKCDHCRDKKKKKGVELQSYGYATKGEAVNDENEPPPVKGKPVRGKINVRLRVWREQLHLCLDHLKEYIGEMIDDPIAALWKVHKQAAMKRGYVNTTYEEAQRMGLI